MSSTNPDFNDMFSNYFIFPISFAVIVFCFPFSAFIVFPFVCSSLLQCCLAAWNFSAARTSFHSPPQRIDYPPTSTLPMPTQIGVPVKLLYECEGHKVSVELTNGEIYRGMMVDAEDSMNLQLQQVVNKRTTYERTNNKERRKRVDWRRDGRV